MWTYSSSVAKTRPDSGAYAAVSVTSKAIVFGAIVLGGYLLPEAAIRWRQGGHALRQLGVVLMFLAVPAVVLLVIAFTKPELFLSVVFHHHYLAASHALAPLVVAMCVLSVSVVLTMYLLAIGRRWVSGVLVVGAAALTGGGTGGAWRSQGDGDGRSHRAGRPAPGHHDRILDRALPASSGPDGLRRRFGAPSPRSSAAGGGLGRVRSHTRPEGHR